MTKKLTRASSFDGPVAPDVPVVPVVRRDGTDGWDAYAPFYDWENVRTIGRRDVAFWRGLAARAGAPAAGRGASRYRARRHSRAAVSARRIRPCRRALRHAAVAPARSRSDGR